MKETRVKTESQLPESINEIEHRYLLSGLPPKLERWAYDIIGIKHYYLATSTIQERFSRRRYIKHHTVPEGTKVYRRTVKIGHGLKRLEFKDECPQKLYAEVKKMVNITALRKVRHLVKVDDCGNIVPKTLVGGCNWELDRFEDRELYLAEVEVPDVTWEVVIPTWLKPYIIKEVTHDRKFEGASLAK